MAERWGDVLISAVHYSADRPHIESVRVHLDRETKIGPAVVMSKAAVVTWLKAGYTFMTITLGDKGWQRGARVAAVTKGGTIYIRTDADPTAADNLGELPKF